MSWLGWMTRREKAERELDAELRFDYDLRVSENIRKGMTEAEARRTARLEFGGLEQIKEECRDVRNLRVLDSVLQDVRYAFRGMRRSPGFTLVAVMTLAVGIGVNAAVFTVTNAVLFKGFPLVRKNDRIVYMTSNPGCCVSYPDFLDWRDEAKSFEGMAAVHGLQKSFNDGDGFPETYITTDVSANTFTVVGIEPILGRDFTHSDELPGAPPVAILRYSFWARRYGKNPAIIGHAVRINGQLTTIIGVMPPGFSFPENQEIWMPLLPPPGVPKRESPDIWFVFGRLADGATIKTARAEMGTIGKRLAVAYPRTIYRRDIPYVRNFHEFFIGPSSTRIYVSMLVAVGFVLLIACANLANLLLARAIGRLREISIRIAIGAGRWRIIRQLLIESMMLSAVGGIVGWWIAKWSVLIYSLAVSGGPVSDSIGGNWFDNVLDYGLDYHALAYLVGISIGTGLLFGLAPASRLFNVDERGALRCSARGVTGGRRTRSLTTLLIVGEVALALVLLAGAGVMVRSFFKVYNADIGVRAENVLTALFMLPITRYPGPEAQILFSDRIATRLESLPGVESVAITSSLPPTLAGRQIAYESADSISNDERHRSMVPVVAVSPDYFRTLGTTPVLGREFNDQDRKSGMPVAIVNEQFANENWPGENVIGRRLRLFDRSVPGAWITIVGVAPNIVQDDATEQVVNPIVYVPFRQRPGFYMWVIARTRVLPGTLSKAFQHQVQVIDPDLPTSLGPYPLTERLALGYRYRGMSGALFVLFATIALLLAAIGLYAVVAHSVSRRSQEIGIRIAMGATGRNILELVFREGMLPLGLGLGIGFVLSLAANRMLRSQLVHVSSADPLTYFLAVAVLIASALLGCWIPARRAMRVDPVVALRNE